MEEEEESEQVLGGVEQVRRLGDQAEQAGMGDFRVELATQYYSDNYLIKLRSYSLHCLYLQRFTTAQE